MVLADDKNTAVAHPTRQDLYCPAPPSAYLTSSHMYILALTDPNVAQSTGVFCHVTSQLLQHLAHMHMPALPGMATACNQQSTTSHVLEDRSSMPASGAADDALSDRHACTGLYLMRCMTACLVLPSLPPKDAGPSAAAPDDN
jgi:hypothetical protein